MIIQLKDVDYIYNPGTPFEKKALDGINLEIEEGEFIGLIGHTGSGKSTLVQHLNGLMKPTKGKIIIDGQDLSSKETKMKIVRQKVGLVFQYPEHQLFEETIYKDIAFGPKNLGLKEDEIDLRVREAMELVGLDFEELKERSPFELSGGQKRRVAIAGVIAMKPKVLILDEPTAGLDPKGRDDILDEIRKIYDKEKITIILVSHSMEDIARLVNRIFVMHKATVALDGPTREIFNRTDELEEMGLGIPQITKFMKIFKGKGHAIRDDILTIEEAKVEILNYLRSKKNA
ncbi:energy-coupling factor transporter ATPase [Gudongella sp. DL1XJH-153]|uniref:energy-coupling factor transporter ATPase n=1 Tax=Gudongella sp. DL1XJH-153 TaxID=3409804 RepID=UPI003BB7CC72